MIRKPTKSKMFKRTEELIQNPYIGFTSFQHFRDDKLYSDIVVDPRNNATETENVECYPIPEYVEQNGWEQGFYPDTTIAYIRILWKEFEPEKGEYHYDVIEKILETAKSCGQTVMFRLMPHSTRACDDVPDWLKEMIPCPERPEGKRVKASPKDPIWISYFGEAVRQIARRFDTNPILDVVDVSLPGAWGEGCQVYDYPKEIVEWLMDIYIHEFPNTKLIGQVCAPWLVKRALDQRPVGWRGDGTGEPDHVYRYFPKVASELSEIWKSAPVSFEAYWWLGEWDRQGWDIDEVIERTLRWHISSFNAKSIPIPYKWYDKIRYWLSKMGYHFAVRLFQYPEEACPGDIIECVLYIENTGVAPIYNYIPVKMRLRNQEHLYEFDTNIDIRTWMPGDKVEQLELKLPANMIPGSYVIELGILEKDGPIIHMPIDTSKSGAYYEMGTIKVE